MTKEQLDIEFLGRQDCPNSPRMEANLGAALQRRGLERTYRKIDLGTLPDTDIRKGYGTPTILINGQDIFGMPEPGPTAAPPS